MFGKDFGERSQGVKRGEFAPVSLLDPCVNERLEFFSPLAEQLKSGLNHACGRSEAAVGDLLINELLEIRGKGQSHDSLLISYHYISDSSWPVKPSPEGRMSHTAVDLAAVREAAARIAGLVHRTPVMTSETLDGLAGRWLFFKCENLQKVGAFKYRGATNAVRKLTEEEAAHGVVTHSSGNHAQALALAARVRGIPAYIVMPRSAAPVKKTAVEGYGGIVTLCEPTLEARERTAAEIVQRTGATLIPPYDHADVIAGQGTTALELLEQVRDLDAIIAPVGGGGLLSGTCVAARGLKPGIRVFGAEPLGADDAARSMAAGTLIPQTAPNTIADGLLTSLGQLTWPFIRDQVERIFTVTDDQIRAAMRLVWERMKLIIEPSAAVPVAVVLADEFRSLAGIDHAGVVLSGGNVNLDKLWFS